MNQLVDPYPPAASGSFETQTLAIFKRLRNAIGQAMAILPKGVQKSQDIQKRFGLSFTLSWQIYRVMRAEHLIEITPHIPTARLMEKFIGAIEKSGVSTLTVEAIRLAYLDFEAHVKNSAGDRAGFEAMTTQLIGGVTDAEIELAHRRSLFDSHRYFSNVEEDLSVAMLMLHPKQGKLVESDIIFFRIRHNLRRLRSATPLKVNGIRVRNPKDDEGGGHNQQHMLELSDNRSDKYGPHILPEFCSRPDLPLVQSTKMDGTVVTTWMPDGVGRSSAIDFAVGTFTSSMDLERHAKGIYSYHLLTSNNIPSRRLIRDVLIHRSMVPLTQFDITRWGYVIDLPEHIYELEQTDIPQLPCSDQLVALGDIDDGLIPEIPNYLPIIRKYCEKFGWTPEDMRLYRMRIEYPLLHSVIRTECLFPAYEKSSK